MSTNEFKDFIKLMAAESGKYIRPYFANPALEVGRKNDQTVVTQADRGAEKILREMIEEKYPHHGIIGEEYGNKDEDAEFVWVLDPIDGTKSFVAGNVQFGTLIALMQDGQPILGAINNPITNQLLLGDNQHTHLNDVPVHVRSCPELSKAILVTTELWRPAKYRDGAKWQTLIDSIYRHYTWGDCYGYHLLSTGGVDIALDPAMMPWDYLALIPVVRGAGGAITSWEGGDPVTGNSIIAAAPEIHAQVVEILNG